MVASIAVVSMVIFSGRYDQFAPTELARSELGFVPEVHKPFILRDLQEVTAEDFQRLFESNIFE